MELKINSSAPNFELYNQDQKLIKLSQFKGKNLILYFYPADDTPGCTKEACNFRDLIEEYKKLGAEILGISRDSVESHKKFRTKYNLNYDLLSDQSGKVHELYQVIKPKTLFGKTSLGTVRTTFLIDKFGKIYKIFNNVKVNGHDLAILESLKSLVKSK